MTTTENSTGGAQTTYREITKSWDLRLPLVSIISPVYNQREYLETLLNGFLTQVSAFPFEIIIRDDGSNDGSREFLCAYQEKYPELIRLSLLDSNSFGHLRPIQELLQLSRGAFIAPCDGDDYWVSPEKIQRQAELLHSNTNVGLVHHPALPSLVGTLTGPSPTVKRRKLVSKRKPMHAVWSTVMFRKIELPWIEVPIQTAGSGDFITMNLLTAHSSTFYLEDKLWAVRRSSEKPSDAAGAYKSMASRLVTAKHLKQMANSERAVRLTSEALSRAVDISGLNYAESQRALRFASWSGRRRLLEYLVKQLWRTCLNLFPARISTREEK
jgi:glycosyltransferase involved in cell wall biosynthesis